MAASQARGHSLLVSVISSNSWRTSRQGRTGIRTPGWRRSESSLRGGTRKPPRGKDCGAPARVVGSHGLMFVFTTECSSLSGSSSFWKQWKEFREPVIEEQSVEVEVISQSESNCSLTCAPYSVTFCKTFRNVKDWKKIFLSPFFFYLVFIKERTSYKILFPLLIRTVEVLNINLFNISI